MSTLAGDFWVCGDCRSINNAGARQCYNCRTPRDRAAVDPSAIDPSTHGRLREIELPEFRSSRWAAALASILILVAAALQVAQFSLASQLLNQQLGGIDATEEQWAYVGSFLIVALGITLLALIAWALWLSRTVTSMPALGLGYPAANGMMAFIENFIPVLNLWRVPAIVRDVVWRLEPKTGGDETMTRGEALVFGAWVGLFGGYIVPRVLGFFTSDIRTLLTISAIGTGLVLIGAIFMVVLIWWIEGRILTRRQAQLAEIGASIGSTAPPDTAAPGSPAPAAPDVVQTRSAFAAANSAPPSSASSFRLPGGETRPAPTGDETPDAQAEATVAPEPAAVAPQPPIVAEPVIEPPLERAEPPLEPAEAPAPPLPSPAADEPTPAVSLVPPPEAAPPVPTVVPEPRPPQAGGGPPNLTIRVSSRGMMTAEMDGELEHVMVDDLGSYAEALSHVGGTATIVVPTEEGMSGLITKRAQRILEDAGVKVTIA
jgi:hypothetical protein